MRSALVIVCTLAACGGAQESDDTLVQLPPDVPESWQRIIGEYSAGADTVSLLEDDGALVVYHWGGERLEITSSANGDFVTATGEAVSVQTGASGRPEALAVGALTLDRLSLGAEDGGTFQITPIRPTDELETEALAARPPEEEGDFRDPELVELITLDPTIALDIRYATTNNFMGEVFYSEPRAFLQRPAAEALVRASAWLRDRGYGLLVHDGYRPWYVTKMFWDATPEELKIFVADPASGSRHNRGCAIDLTLYDLQTGEPITMTGGYDEMSPRSYPDYPGGTELQRWHRELLREAMEAQGFAVYEAEWWHFDYEDWRSYRIGNERFEDLGIG